MGEQVVLDFFLALAESFKQWDSEFPSAMQFFYAQYNSNK